MKVQKIETYGHFLLIGLQIIFVSFGRRTNSLTLFCSNRACSFGIVRTLDISSSALITFLGSMCVVYYTFPSFVTSLFLVTIPSPSKDVNLACRLGWLGSKKAWADSTHNLMELSQGSSWASFSDDGPSLYRLAQILDLHSPAMQVAKVAYVKLCCLLFAGKLATVIKIIENAILLLTVNDTRTQVWVSSTSIDLNVGYFVFKNVG